MYLRLDVDGKRGNARLKASIAVRQRTREMYEALGSGGGHTGQIYRRSGYSFEDAVSRSVEKRGVAKGGEERRGPACLVLGRQVCSRCPQVLADFSICTVWLGSSWGCAH